MKDKLFRYSALYTATTLLAGAINCDLALANPTDGQVVGGVANIVTTPQKTDIYQHTDKAVINWNTFDIKAGEHTQFHQPSANSAALNRVTGGMGASQIDGAITANGNVVLVNPNGIMFGKDANINVGGLIATTADSTTDDFMQGKNQFGIAGNPDARIVNGGTITAKQAGLVGLVAPNVENNGTINATLGKVTLGSAETFAVDLYGDKLIQFGMSEKTATQLVRNTGNINAAGGEITLSASEGRTLVENLVQVKGEILAPTVAEKAGKIIISGNNADLSISNATIDASGEHKAGTILIGGDLQGTGTTARANTTTIDAATSITANANTTGDGGKVIVWADDSTRFAGNIEAKAGVKSGNGGFVEVSGKKNLFYDGKANTSAPKGKTGTLLLDPEDIVIANAAGDITPAAITTALGSNHVVIHTKNSGLTENGDITVSNDINYNSGNSLTLLATRHINANANIQNAGNGAVNLVAGWDQTTADPAGTAGTAVNPGGAFNISAITGNSASYGNNLGSIFINNAAGMQGVAVGSKDGATTVAGYNLTLRGGSNSDNYAHLGYELTTGSATGAISAYISNDISLIGGTSAARGYTQIGHGSENDSFTSASGNITLRSRDLSVSTVGGAGRSYSIIGHGGFAAHGTKSGNIDITSRAVSITSGTGATNLLAQIGHGGQGSTGTITSNININATGDIALQSGWNAAIIGNSQPFGGSGDATGNISISTTGNLRVSSNGGSEHTQIGHDGSGNFAGNITATAQNITIIGGNRSTIGHANGSGTRQGNILLTSNGELSVVDNGGTANIGHLSSDGTGVFSNANVRIIANSLDFADDAVDATSFDLNNGNFITRMIDNLAGGDVTIASKNAPITFSNAWSATSASNRNLNFLSYGNIDVNQNITHNGNGGRVNLIAGWDGTNGINPTDGTIDFGTLRLRDATDVGVLTLANTRTITAGATSGTGIIAAGADRFTNNNAAGGLSAAGSRYVIYSTSSGVTTLGTLTPTSLGGGYALRQPAGIAAGNHIIYDSSGNLVFLVGGQTYTYNGTAQLVTTSGAAGYGTYYSLDNASLTTLTGAGYTVGNFTSSLTGNVTFSAADSTNLTAGADITGNINTLASSLGYDLSFNNAPINELVINPALAPAGGGSFSAGVSVEPSVISSAPPILAAQTTSPSISSSSSSAIPTLAEQPLAVSVTSLADNSSINQSIIPATVQLVSQNGMTILSPASSTETDSTSSQQDDESLEYKKESDKRPTSIFGNLLTIHPKIAKLFGVVDY